MKKTIFTLILSAIFGMSMAQELKTYSVYDTNQSGDLTVTDVTGVVDKVKENVATSSTQQYVTAEDLNKVLSEINENTSKCKEHDLQIEIIKKSLSSIAEKVGAKTPEEIEEEYAKYNGHAYVDLGLSVKWATMNVGATEVAGTKKNSHTGKLDCYGEYYAWGETSPKDSYDWASYKWMAEGQSSWQYCTKYTTADNQTSASWYKDGTYVGTAVDGKTYKSLTQLELSDDAAHANWGGTWRMPTTTEQQELYNNCYWEWTSSYNNTGVTGYIVYKVKNDSDKGKTKYSSSSTTTVGSYSLGDNHIFLPAAGYRYDSYLSSVGSDGNYWSSSLFEFSSISARGVYFGSSYVDWSSNYRCSGFSVRPVCQ